MSYDKCQTWRVDEGQLLITQTDRDRLVPLKKANEQQILQNQAAEEVGVTEP